MGRTAPPRRTRRRVAAGLAAAALVAAGCTSDDTASKSSGPQRSGPPAVDRSWYILPPGNYGGVPTNPNSLDQLPLYDGLTPLRGNVNDKDLDTYFIRQELKPAGATTEEKTPRPGLTILYDSYGVPHITGRTREDLAFGSGWVTARDRGVLLDLGRGPAKAAAADIPGVNPRELITSATPFEASAATEQLLADQLKLLVTEYGDEGQQVVDDATAGAAGANAYWESTGQKKPPATAADIISVAALIGSMFGQGGGSEATNAELLADLQGALGKDRGREAWEDLVSAGDPETPTTIDTRFDYPTLTGGDVKGSVQLDAGSVAAYQPSPGDGAGQGLVNAAGPPPDRKASNWLMVGPKASTNGAALGVLGPQIGYTYPEIVQQMHLTGPGIDAQGAAAPGIGMYLLVGRTRDYAWSLTSAGHDVRDVYAEILCEPDGSMPTIASTHYEHDGTCRPFENFDAGILAGEPVSYGTTVHGPVIGTATTDGKPVALARRRSTFGRDALNLIALKRMTEGQASTPQAFYDTANKFEFTFNWGWVGREGIAYFSSGRLPKRPAGLDRRLPTLGTGAYEWDGFLSQDKHPHANGGPNGRLLNWNNQSAPGFIHGDNGEHGSVYGVELFDKWPDTTDLAGVVSVMNRAATEYGPSLVWPTVSAVLAKGAAPSPAAKAVVATLDAWVTDDAPDLDTDADGKVDSAGFTILTALWEPMVKAAIQPTLGAQTDSVYKARELGKGRGASLLDKDLRKLLGQDVDGPFRLAYCGAGDLERCSTDLWAAVERVTTELTATFGSADPTTWLGEAERTKFIPGLINQTMRTTNRPTFQQLIELVQK